MNAARAATYLVLPGQILHREKVQPEYIGTSPVDVCQECSMRTWGEFVEAKKSRRTFRPCTVGRAIREGCGIVTTQNTVQDA